MPKRFTFNNPPLTKKRFESLLKKAAQPVSEWKSEKVGKETSESHSFDDYTDKCKSLDKIEGKEG